MARARRVAAVVLASVLAMTATACGGEDEGPPVTGVSTNDDGYAGSHLGDAPFEIADVPLTDTDGAAYSIATAAAPLKIVFFGYSMCPDVCQVVMSTIGSALTRLDEAQQDAVDVVFVTTDPARDTAGVLRDYLDQFGDGMIGLTGDLTDIVKLGDSFKVSIEKGQKLPSGGYEVDHSTYTYGVLGDGAQVVWNSSTSPAEMAADMIKLLKA